MIETGKGKARARALLPGVRLLKKEQKGYWTRWTPEEHKRLMKQRENKLPT